MQKKQLLIRILVAAFLLAGLVSCASTPGYYNTQRGAAIGAGIGALAGQVIGRNTEGTLLGAGIGTVAGAILGNAVDQDQRMSRETIYHDRRAENYGYRQNRSYNDYDHHGYDDNDGTYVETIPGPVDQHTNCRKVTKRVWDKGVLVSEKVEEVCEGEKYSRDY